MSTKIACQKQENPLAWISLGEQTQFGPMAFQKWLQGYQNGTHQLPLPTPLSLATALRCQNEAIQILPWDSPLYPPLLKQSRYARPVIYAKGVSSHAWEAPNIAMVGTRSPSWQGRELANALVDALRDYACQIISGLAIGIDLCCHQAALAANIPTFAVLAHGLDEEIHGERGKVARSMLQAGGGLISPYAPGTKAYRGNFLGRNAIIAGMCQATMVVESRERGGALHTAELAMEEQRILLAPPGDILRATAQGPNMLIESQSAEAVWLPQQFPLLAGLSPTRHLPKNSSISEHSTASILHIFSGECCSLEEIIERTGVELPKILQALSVCEINGSVKRNSAGIYQFQAANS